MVFVLLFVVGDVGVIEMVGVLDMDVFGVEGYGYFNGFFYGVVECDMVFELESDVFSDELSFDFGFFYFLDVEEDFFVGEFGEFFFDFFDFLVFVVDDDVGMGGVNFDVDVV